MNFGKYVLVVWVLGVFCLGSCEKNHDTKQVNIGFSQAMTNDDWRRSMNDAMRLQASLNPGVKLTIRDADYQVQTQIKQIEELIADSLDIIIVSPIRSKPITPVIQKALNTGIPVLVVDRKTESGTYTAYLGADNIEVGRNAARKIISSEPEKPLKIVEIKGMPGSSPAEERSMGFHQIMAEYENIDIVKTIESDWEKSSMQDDFRQLLVQDNHIDYVFAHNDRMAKGAWEIARDLGVEKDINFIGIDGLNGSEGGIQLVQDGILKATILYPTGGDEAIKLALRILKNESVPKNNILTTTIIDKVNADIMKNQFDKINEQQAEIEGKLTAIRQQEALYYSQNNLLKIAMALLAVVLSLAIYSIYSIFAIRKKNRQLELTNSKITVQRNQIEKIAEEVKAGNEAKLNFFTGLSHEFKTPITLILSSIESINDTVREKGSRIANEVELIYNNSNRLLRLINQLLDFRKIEDRKFTLRASKTNLYTFSKNIFKDFQRESKKRNITFDLTSNDPKLEIYIDRNLMDKVYFNLLSNAFKFTPDNGRITMAIEDNPDLNTVNIHFRDSGIGIPNNELKHVFQPFFKGSNNRKNSSGIGLHLSKEFTELHKGKIAVKSVRGTDFTLTLYKGTAHFDDQELIAEQDLVETNVIDFASDYLADETFLVEAPQRDHDSYSILIIEDNRDLLLFLKSKLLLEYEVHVSDGTDAIEKAFEVIPDVILCDINLPEKNGFQICEILKKDLRTSHIPTIILTASGSKESYLKGLQSGADLYLTKPFSYAILIQSIKSLRYNREKLRFYYTNNIYKIEDTNAFGNLEQQFINKLNTLIRDNIDKTEFSVEHLAEALNISRVQLYRKVKAMLGMSVSDYMGNFRLEKAKAMLNGTALSISEIAYANGFSSPNYFSTTFKNKYGTSPASYRKASV